MDYNFSGYIKACSRYYRYKRIPEDLAIKIKIYNKSKELQRNLYLKLDIGTTDLDILAEVYGACSVIQRYSIISGDKELQDYITNLLNNVCVLLSTISKTGNENRRKKARKILNDNMYETK